ncbi:A-type inclusion protein [Pseudocowpox virus]
MEELVEKFRTFVSANWYQKLNSQTCIPIEIRKLVRNLLREYIKHAPPMSDVHKKTNKPLNLFMTEYVNKNPVYNELFKNNVWLYEGAMSIKTFTDMSTVGRFLLMVVYRIMSGTTDDGHIMDGRDATNPTYIDIQMDYFCYLFLWYMGSISHYYSNKSLVFGIPMYWWRGDGLMQNVYTKLDNYFNNELKDSNKFSNGAVTFARYMANIYDKIGNDTKNMPHINIAFDAFNTNFIYSVPEFMLDGLCYTVYDKITKNGMSFYLDIFMAPTRYNGFTYKTLDHTKQGVVDGITKEDVGDRGAIRFTYHPNFNRRVGYLPKGVPVRRQPNEREDTSVKQHKVDEEKTPIFTRNPENSGYYLGYRHYSNTEPTISNEYERRDILTYDEEVCTKHRFDGDIDDDKTSYHRILRDRFMGFFNVKPPLAEVEVVGDDEEDDSMCMDIDKLDRLLSPLEKSVVDRPCCSKKLDGLGSTASTGSNYPIVRETYRPTWTRSNRPSIFTRRHPYNTYNLDNWWRQQRHGAIW